MLIHKQLFKCVVDTKNNNQATNPQMLHLIQTIS